MYQNDDSFVDSYLTYTVSCIFQLIRQINNPRTIVQLEARPAVPGLVIDIEENVRNIWKSRD